MLRRAFGCFIDINARAAGDVIQDCLPLARFTRSICAWRDILPRCSLYATLLAFFLRHRSYFQFAASFERYFATIFDDALPSYCCCALRYYDDYATTCRRLLRCYARYVTSYVAAPYAATPLPPLLNDPFS